jgi:antigen 43
VVNAGSIAGGSSGGRLGIALHGSGSVANQLGGVITGNYAIVAYASGATITNAGSMSGAYAVLLNGAGSLTNQASGKISGSSEGVLANALVTVVNAGIITGVGYGVQLAAGGTVVAQSGGTISSPGIAAVWFGAAHTNRLVVQPNATFVGSVNGGNTSGGSFISTLELASSASTGTLSGLGTQFINFAQITIDAGAAWTLAGPNTLAAGSMLTNAGALTLMDATLNSSGAVINNGGIVLDPSTMTVTNLLGTGSVTIAAGGTLEVTGSIASTETILLDGTAAYLHLDNPAGVAGSINDLSIGETIDLKGVSPASVHESAGTLTIDGIGSFGLTFSAGDKLGTSASADGTALTAVIACFAEGTAIATPAGPVPVEALRAGDLVRTVSGTARPVRWIGYRTLDLTRHAAPERARPIRIAANAFADNVPSRDLRLSPDHAVLLDGLLIPIKLLRNDASIVRDTDCRTVTYYHVELDTHDVLLAEGLAAESYIDTGNRSIFQNGGLAIALHPTFEAAQAQREAASCAPFATDPDRIEPIWQTLAARAAASGLAVSNGPSHHVIAAGRIIQPLSRTATCLAFLLPAATEHVRLVSSGSAQPWIDDPRPRGAAVTRLTLRAGATVETLGLDHPGLRDGWWDTERHGDRMWRWTNGDATISLNLDRPAILEIQLVDTTRTRHARQAA